MNRKEEVSRLKKLLNERFGIKNDADLTKELAKSAINISILVVSPESEKAS
ncbi:hypothetical protein [Pectinatus frisingensis]|uniref:hypothetical protein n=1 Tax=Pectinatus frisingensis TaxID=865 RepID=UPI0018C563DD|nr:hypothetical protein [Pectinatus frisingensis]